METISLYKLVKDSLPETAWATVIGALKHDRIIWESINKPRFIEKLRAVNLTNLNDWSPANLGLISIDFKFSAKDLQKSNLPILDESSHNKAMLLLEEIRLEHGIDELDKAILIALAIRDKHCLGDTWFSIRREIFGKKLDLWQSVLTCLHSLAGNPIDFLNECICDQNPISNSLNLLNILLSHPYDDEQRVNILSSLLLGENDNDPSIIEILRLIQNLSLLRPNLAVELSRKILDQKRIIKSEKYFRNNVITNNLFELEIHLLDIELQDLVNMPDLSNQHIDLAFDALINILVGLTSKLRTINNDHFPEEEPNEENDLLVNKKHINQLFNPEVLVNHPLHHANTILRLIDNKQYLEAEKYVRENNDVTSSDLIKNFVLAKSAFEESDIEQSTLYARNAVTYISNRVDELLDILTNHAHNVFSPFLELLLDLDLIEETITLAQKALSFHTFDFELYTILGKALLADFKPEEAAIAFYNAVMIKPGNITIRRQLAGCLENIEQWNEAYNERKNIIEEIYKINDYPDIADLHKLTICAIRLDHFDEAIQLCEKAILLDADNGYSYSLIGNAYINRGEIEAAFEQFEKGIQLSPQIPETWLELADAQKKVENIDGELEILHAASQALPASGQIYLALGDMLLSQNALTEALSAYRHGIENEPNNDKLIYKLGTTLQRLGHLDEAKQFLDKAHRRKPNQTEIAYAYAKVLLQLGEKKNAIPVLDIVVRSNPKYSEPFLLYAESVLTTQPISIDSTTLDKVLITLQKALAINPKNPIGNALLGETLALRKEYILAKEAFQAALETNLIEEEEWFARLSLGMGKVALALGQEDVALASLQEAVQADPNNTQIHKALSEVYLAVNLPENALQSARAALNLAIDDIDTLAWYADQMLQLSETESNSLPHVPANEHVTQIQSEALNALNQAVQLAPNRADLIAKLGKMQLILGDKESGISTLNSLINNEYSEVNDLATAGKYLSESGDFFGAISCMEQAYYKEADKSSQSTALLLIDLARLYHLEGDHESALQALNRATENNSSFSPIYYAKANLLLELKREDDALSCVMEGLDKSNDKHNQIHLFLLASIVHRKRGELKAALEFAQQGLSICETDISNIESNKSAVIEIITLISNLFQAVLKPNRGRLLMKEMERKVKIDITENIDYCCSYLELFFDVMDNAEMTSLISQMIEQAPNHPRILALQARIFNRRGLYQTSMQMLHAAMEAANLKSWNSEFEKQESSVKPISVWYSLSDSALELFQWDTALYLNHQALEVAPTEPRAHINHARTMVLRAEYQWLCEKADVTTNSPGSIATSIESRAIFEKAISDAILNIPAIDHNPNEEVMNPNLSKLNPIINRWNARGMAMFGNDEEIKQAMSVLIKLNDQRGGTRLPINTDDIAALIGADIRMSAEVNGDKYEKLIQMSRAYSQDSLLPLQSAIAISDTKPVDAINLLNEFENSHSDENPLMAIRNAIKAKVLTQLNQFDEAKLAIDNALASLPNEPEWHKLAADIYQRLNNIPEAIHHIDAAIRIVPHGIDNHIKLGKILIENPDVESANQGRAVQVLERACRLEPENADPWYYLSKAYLSIMDIAQAISCVDMALSLAPENIEILSLRGEIALHENKPQIALDFANQALQFDKNDKQAILIKSQALRDLDRTELALEVLELAMESMEDPLALQIEYAILLNDVRGPQASIDALEQLVQQYPENPKILSLLAKNMADLGDTEAAIQTAQRALRDSNGSLHITSKAELHYLLGSLLIQARQLDQAIYHLSESIALTPNYIEPYLELGHAQQERRQYRQALEAYQQATRIAPNDPRPHYQAGIAFKEGKDYQASESMLRRAADLAPDDVNIKRQLAAVVALNLVHNPRSKRIEEE